MVGLFFFVSLTGVSTGKYVALQTLQCLYVIVLLVQVSFFSSEYRNNWILQNEASQKKFYVKENTELNCDLGFYFSCCNLPVSIEQCILCIWMHTYTHKLNLYIAIYEL